MTIRVIGDRSAMNAVGSSSMTVVCSLSGQACRSWRIKPRTDGCPPGARIPPSLQYW